MTSMHAATVTLDTVPPLVITPTSGDVTLDEGWAPYAQAVLECPAESTAQLVALDPRTTTRALVETSETFGRVDTLADMTSRYGGGRPAPVTTESTGDVSNITDANFHDWDTPGAPYRPSISRTFDLGLRSREIDHNAGTVTLDLASDEAIMQDSYSLYAGETISGRTDFLGTLRDRVPAALDDVDAGAASASWDRLDWPWRPGVSAWDYAAGMVQQIGYRLWCDEFRVWHLHADQPTPAGSAVVLDSSVNIETAVDRISRDAEYYTGAIVTYEWSDAAGATQKAYDLAWFPPGPPRLYSITYNRPYPGPGAANRIARTMRTRGHEIDLTAISDYDVTPGRPLTIALPSTPVQGGVTSAVTWSLPAATMTVRSRALADTGAAPTTDYTPTS